MGLFQGEWGSLGVAPRCWVRHTLLWVRLVFALFAIREASRILFANNLKFIIRIFASRIFALFFIIRIIRIIREAANIRVIREYSRIFALFALNCPTMIVVESVEAALLKNKQLAPSIPLLCCMNWAILSIKMSDPDRLLRAHDPEGCGNRFCDCVPRPASQKLSWSVGICANYQALLRIIFALFANIREYSHYSRHYSHYSRIFALFALFALFAWLFANIYSHFWLFANIRE